MKLLELPSDLHEVNKAELRLFEFYFMLIAINN